MVEEAKEQRVLTRAQREARMAFRQVEAEKALTDHERTRKRFTRIASGSRLNGWHERRPIVMAS